MSCFKPGDWVEYGELKLKVIEGGRLALNPIQSIVPDWSACRRIEACADYENSDEELRAWEGLKRVLRGDSLLDEVFASPAVMTNELSFIEIPVYNSGTGMYDMCTFVPYSIIHSKKRIQVWKLSK